MPPAYLKAQDVPPQNLGRCYGKIAYASSSAAFLLLRRLEGKGRRNSSRIAGGGLRVYRCGVCHQWHLGRVGPAHRDARLG